MCHARVPGWTAAAVLRSGSRLTIEIPGGVSRVFTAGPLVNGPEQMAQGHEIVVRDVRVAYKDHAVLVEQGLALRSGDAPIDERTSVKARDLDTDLRLEASDGHAHRVSFRRSVGPTRR